MTAELEVERVARHIARAEGLARTRDLSSLSHLQRIIRQLLLRVLADYRAAGRFPKNRDFADQRPYFVDADGTRCAMAHLLEHGGEHALVAKIARERNNAYVRELADESRLLAWLEAAGLTVEEAAAIQPGYCATTASCICGGEDFSPVAYPVPAAGVLQALVQQDGLARVEMVFGDRLGFAVGDDLEIGIALGFGRRVLIPIDAESVALFAAVELDGHQKYNCTSQAVAKAPQLTAEQFFTAVQSPDCAAALIGIDPAWGEESCTGDDILPPSDDKGGGCSSAGADSMSVGVLLALVAALARRR